MGKIAHTSNHPVFRRLAQGDGWSVADVVCSAGPRDRPFEEQHAGFSVAVVASGTFEYRSAAGRELMTPGSLLLGNAGLSFECSHAHGVGDRCVSFHFTAEYFERLASDAGAAGLFCVPRLPPMRATSSLIARAIAQACAGLAGADPCWQELSIQLAAQALELADGVKPTGNAPPGAVARAARVARGIERDFAAELDLAGLARQAGLSPYHFLRSFQRAAGVTPHQFILRQRLREAARRLRGKAARVVDIALECGFRDLSNFNHAFRAEFGVSPRQFRSS